MEKITVGDLEIEITRKKIKNLYIRVKPPSGKVSISAPQRMRLSEIRMFAESKQEWIRNNQKRYTLNQKQQPLSFVSGEIIQYQGSSYMLRVMEDNRQRVEISEGQIFLWVRPDSSQEQRKKVLYRWYREKLKEQIPPLLEKWQSIIGVRAESWAVKDMKTRWGTCNVRSGKIWFSLRLVHEAPRFLEYVVVHEMVHFLEKSHNRVFSAYMSKYLPEWKSIRRELNGRPVSG